jgi:hypothetical protein
MTLEEQYKKIVEAGFDPKKEILAYSVGIKTPNGAYLVDPIVSSRADGQDEYTLRRFPKNNIHKVQYLKEMGYQLYTPPKAPASKKQATAKK